MNYIINYYYNYLLLIIIIIIIITMMMTTTTTSTAGTRSVVSQGNFFWLSSTRWDLRTLHIYHGFMKRIEIDWISESIQHASEFLKKAGLRLIRVIFACAVWDWPSKWLVSYTEIFPSFIQCSTKSKILDCHLPEACMHLPKSDPYKTNNQNYRKSRWNYLFTQNIWTQAPNICEVTTLYILGKAFCPISAWYSLCEMPML